MNTPKKCEACSRSYGALGRSRTTHANSRFCSQQCHGASRRAETLDDEMRKNDRMCVTCGSAIPFGNLSMKRVSRRKFCGNLCASNQGKGSWRDGKFITPKGYVRIIVGPNKTEFEHRIVAERALGRKLKSDEIVHHINCDKSDNRNENLLVCDSTYHMWLHNEMSRRYAEAHFGFIGAPSVVANSSTL